MFLRDVKIGEYTVGNPTVLHVPTLVWKCPHVGLHDNYQSWFPVTDCTS